MASKRKYNKTTKELQLLVLKEMLQSKNALFGQFKGAQVTKTDIQSEWLKVSRLAASYGLTTDDDGEKFRKTTWQNWRRNAVSKIDHIKKTGAGGAGAEDLLDENDKIILAIVGDEVAFGIGSEESHGDRNDSSEPNQPVLAKNHQQPSSSGERIKPSRSAESRSNVLRDKLLEVTLYLRTLECKEKEVLLNLPPSEFTKNIKCIVLSSDDEVDEYI